MSSAAPSIHELRTQLRKYWRDGGSLDLEGLTNRIRRLTETGVSEPPVDTLERVANAFRGTPFDANERRRILQALVGDELPRRIELSANLLEMNRRQAPLIPSIEGEAPAAAEAYSPEPEQRFAPTEAQLEAFLAKQPPEWLVFMEALRNRVMGPKRYVGSSIKSQVLEALVLLGPIAFFGSMGLNLIEAASSTSPAMEELLGREVAPGVGSQIIS